MSVKIPDSLKHGVKAGVLLVIVALLTLEATSLIQYYFSQQGIKEESTARARGQLESSSNKIMDIVNQTEAAVRNSVWIAQWCLNVPDSLIRVAQRVVEDNPVVVGSTVAVVPGYLKDHPLFSPYVCEGPDGLEFKTLATEEYDYPSQEWFVKPLELQDGYWSEPYVDEGGGNILMTTYSLPIRDQEGEIAAILTADISLEWLTKMVGNIQVYPHAYSMILSREGQVVVSPVNNEESEHIAREVIKANLQTGADGEFTVQKRALSDLVFYTPIERTGWVMSIVIPESVIYAGIRRIALMVGLLQVLGIMMIILIISSVFKNQRELNEINAQKDRMEGELQVASNIQMSMVPKIFPPFPNRDDLDMSAFLVPAKEVGGDLYDFFIRDEKLHFCIGDVSGKGVPASLLMAVTRTQYRTLATHYDSPSRIVTSINDGMTDMNDNNMFVTFFCGILDLETGLLKYCNAGHNAPYILTDAIRELDVKPNLPLGIMDGMVFEEQEVMMHYDDALFLYTDGLNEAENINHDQFGDEGIRAVLHTRRDADGHLKAMEKAVIDFRGEADQSDDLTMLFIHYLKK
jgi:sigma-B regulation protein RsbU (phosphoserine phosphatase)